MTTLFPTSTQLARGKVYHPRLLLLAPLTAYDPETDQLLATRPAGERDGMMRAFLGKE